MIRSADRNAKPGDVVNIYDKRGELFGRGLYNPNSQIALRVLAHGDRPIDETFWRAKVQGALELRQTLQLADVTDAYRLIHAEADGLSGLIVERYADYLVFEVFSLGMYQRAEMLGKLIAESLGSPTSLDRPDRVSDQWRVYVRADDNVERQEDFRVDASAQPEIGSLTIKEHGVRYRVNVAGGQKTGFFCDQRDNRKRFASYCRGTTVLDVCCYSGGFSLCAKLLGDAKEVTAIDIDENALAIAKENAKLNQARIQFAQADAFAYLRQMIENGKTFDRVILDPPKFATSRDEFEKALHKYQDLNALAIQVVRPGGLLLTCSCSGLVSMEDFTNVVHRAASHQGRPIQTLDASGASPDHPVDPTCPESLYLKTLTLRVGELPL
jgi:23S rRNA (cytosine1962-C5)-methyltransferase